MNHWTVNDIPDLRGRVALVIGANRGLGLETTRALATHGAHVIMAVRNLNQGRLAEIHDLNDWDRRIIEEFRANGGQCWRSIHRRPLTSADDDGSKKWRTSYPPAGVFVRRRSHLRFPCKDRDPSSTTPCNFCESVVYCLHEQSTYHF